MTRLIGLALLALASVAATSGGGQDGSEARISNSTPVLAGVRPVRLGTGPDGRLSEGMEGTRGAREERSAYVVSVYGLAADGIATPEVTLSTPGEVITPTPAITPEPTRDAPVYGGFPGEITHYGESFNGQTMACGGTYWSSDASIAAVPYPSRNQQWPCGTRFVVSGPAGSIEVVRTDSCPGCNHSQLDLSEAGMMLVCGYLGRCPVRIEVR